LIKIYIFNRLSIMSFYDKSRTTMCDVVQSKLCFTSIKKTALFIIATIICMGIWIVYFIALGINWNKTTKSNDYLYFTYGLFPLLCCAVMTGIYVLKKKQENKQFVILTESPKYPNNIIHYPQAYENSTINYISFPTYGNINNIN
jgi:hypothetical protein